jgi:hypothetical protein
MNRIGVLVDSIILIVFVSFRQPNPENLKILKILIKIAAVLSAVDEEISTLEKQLAAYKQQKLGLMQQLLTGRIRIGGF